MAIGRRKRERQGELWVEAGRLVPGPGHPFYRRLNEILDQHGFDDRVEAISARFYAETMGRPSLAPAVYFRMLLIGYFDTGLLDTTAGPNTSPVTSEVDGQAKRVLLSLIRVES